MADLALFLGQTFIVSMAIVALTMGLSVFFKWLPRQGPPRPGIHVRSASALFEEGRRYDVLLSSGQRLPALRFEGLVQADADAGWSLNQLAVMRRADGGKVICGSTACAYARRSRHPARRCDLPWSKGSSISFTARHRD